MKDISKFKYLLIRKSPSRKTESSRSIWARQWTTQIFINAQLVAEKVWQDTQLLQEFHDVFALHYAEMRGNNTLSISSKIVKMQSLNKRRECSTLYSWKDRESGAEAMQCWLYSRGRAPRFTCKYCSRP